MFAWWLRNDMRQRAQSSGDGNLQHYSLGQIETLINLFIGPDDRAMSTAPVCNRQRDGETPLYAAQQQAFKACVFFYSGSI